MVLFSYQVTRSDGWKIAAIMPTCPALVRYIYFNLVNISCKAFAVEYWYQSHLLGAPPPSNEYLGQFKELLLKQIESELVTVTELAKLYRVTGKELTKNDTERGNARRLNELLIEQGFQIKNPKSKTDSSQPNYLPTEKRQEFSELIFQQGEGSQKTIQQLRWHKGIVDVMQ